jgi:hypothetical protein
MVFQPRRGDERRLLNEMKTRISHFASTQRGDRYVLAAWEVTAQRFIIEHYVA